MLNILGDIKHVFNACDIFRPVPHKIVMAKFMKDTPFCKYFRPTTKKFFVYANVYWSVSLTKMA